MGILSWKKQVDEEFRKGREERGEGEYAKTEEAAETVTEAPRPKSALDRMGFLGAIGKTVGLGKPEKGEKKKPKAISLYQHLGVTKSKYKGVNPHIRIRF